MNTEKVFVSLCCSLQHHTTKYSGLLRDAVNVIQLCFCDSYQYWPKLVRGMSSLSASTSFNKCQMYLVSLMIILKCEMKFLCNFFNPPCHYWLKGNDNVDNCLANCLQEVLVCCLLIFSRHFQLLLKMSITDEVSLQNIGLANSNMQCQFNSLVMTVSDNVLQQKPQVAVRSAY